jgi:hypothetical protein
MYKYRWIDIVLFFFGVVGWVTGYTGYTGQVYALRVHGIE